MLMQPHPQARVQGAPWPFVGAWLLASTIMIVASWHAITHLEFPDPDDALRLQQVRDWLAGQSWFDVTQYRLDPPGGVPMHWSRLVDVPIAGLILLLRPLLGPANAELAAIVLVPLLTMGVVMALVARLTTRLLDRQHALLAVLLVPVSVAAMAQLRPLRVDHHGWQIAFAVAATLAALDKDRRRSGLVAGGLAALWLQISLEGLPFTAAVATLFGLRWLLDSAERERLIPFAGALAGGSLVLFSLTKAPSAWTMPYCDAVTAPQLAMLCVGAIGTVAMARMRSLPAKLAACALVGGAAAVTLAATAPQCAAGPFEALDPLVHRFWYERVLEGQPLWRQTTAVAGVVIAFPLVGLYGTWRAFGDAYGRRRTEWGLLLYLLVASTCAAILIQREGAIANMLALPGGVWLFERALARARTLAPLPRLAGTLAGLLLVTPSYAIGAIDSQVAKIEGGRKYEVVLDCVTREQFGRLDSLPRGTFAAPLDISPAIIVFTHQRAIASGHHRAAAAMRDVIRIFTLPPEQSRSLLASHGANYVAVCPGLIEPALYQAEGSNGLWAQLARGDAPSWLEPVRFGTPMRLHVWRVKPAG